MKKIIPGLLLFAQAAVGQTSSTGLVESFKSLEVANISAETLHLINTELQKVAGPDYTALVRQQQLNFYKRFDLGISRNLDSYVSYFNDRLQATRMLALANDPLLRMGKDYLATKATPILSYYTGNNSSAYVAAFITPAIQAGAQKYSEDLVKQTLNSAGLKPLFSQIIHYAVPLLQKEGITIEASVPSIREKLRFMHKPLLSRLADEERPYAGEVLDLLAEQAKPLLKTTTNSTLTPNEYNHLFVNITGTVLHDTKASYKELTADFDKLIKNEIRLQETLSSIKSDWNTVNETIKSISNKLLPLQKGTSTDWKSYNTLAARQAQLAAQNALRLDVINNYVNKGVPLATAADQAIKIGQHVAKVFDQQERDKFIGQLTKLKDATLSQAVNAGAQTLSSLSAFFPDNPSLRRVATFAHYAITAVNIGTGVGNLFSGNPAGALTVIQGLQGLFGGSSTPPKSPELQMMEQMMDYMQQEFKQLNGKLDEVNRNLQEIDHKLNALTEAVQLMYRDTMKGLQVVSGQLDNLETLLKREAWKSDLILKILSSYINLPTTDCTTMMKLFVGKENISFSTYEEIYETNPSNCSECLKFLNSMTNLNSVSVDIGAFFAVPLSTLGNSQISGAEIAREILHEEYEPTLDLFMSYYGATAANTNQTINALLGPPRKIQDGLSALKNASTERLLINDPFREYYSAPFLHEFAGFFAQFSEYLLLSTEATFRPMTIEQYFQYTKAKPTVVEAKRRQLLERMQRLLIYINEAITQQSMMAGTFMMQNTFDALTGNDETKRKLAEKVLSNNMVFAKNFASYVIYNAIDGTNFEYAKQYYEAQADFNKLGNLNQIFSQDVKNTRKNQNLTRFQGISLSFTRSANSSVESIVLRIKTGNSPAITLPVPEPIAVIGNELVQSDDFYALQKVKEKIVSKIIDLAFISNLAPKDPKTGISQEEMKYLFPQIAPIGKQSVAATK